MPMQRIVPLRRGAIGRVGQGQDLGMTRQGAVGVRQRRRLAPQGAPGEVLIWDNFAAMHSATPIDYSAEDGKRRLLHRISIKGVAPIYKAPTILQAA